MSIDYYYRTIAGRTWRFCKVCGARACADAVPNDQIEHLAGCIVLKKERDPISVQTYCRFECPQEDNYSQDIPLGPFAQLTYESLRCGPDGDTVASYVGGEWVPSLGFRIKYNLGNQRWTDIVIWGER